MTARREFTETSSLFLKHEDVTLLSLLKRYTEWSVLYKTRRIRSARSHMGSNLATKVGLECKGRTIQKAMGTMDYHKCRACRKGWVNEKLAQRRVEYATVMLERYPEPKDWHRVRLRDEVHFGWGPSRETAYHSSTWRKDTVQACVQNARRTGPPRIKKRHHCWAAVGGSTISNSDIHFLQLSPGNPNGGKTSRQVYIDPILDPPPIVKRRGWEAGQRLRLGGRLTIQVHGPGENPTHCTDLEGDCALSRACFQLLIIIITGFWPLISRNCWSKQQELRKLSSTYWG